MSKKVCICETVVSPGHLRMATSQEENEHLSLSLSFFFFFTDFSCPTNGLGTGIIVIYFRVFVALDSTRRKRIRNLI